MNLLACACQHPLCAVLSHPFFQKIRFLLALILFISISFSSVIRAQNECKCAEEQRRLPEIIQFFNTGKVDSAVLIFEQIKRLGTPECRMSYCNAMSQYYFNKNEYVKVKPLMDEERRLLDSLQCGKQSYSRHFSTYGNYYMSTNNYEKAADCFLNALSYAEGDPNLLRNQQRALLSLSIVFANLKQYPKQMIYLKRAEALVLQIKQKSAENPELKLSFNNELGTVLGYKAACYNHIFEQTKERAYLDSALVSAHESLRLGIEVKNRHTVCDAYLSIMAQAQHLNQFTKALPYTDSILMFAPNALLYKYRHAAFKSKAQIYQQLKDYRNAAIFADSALVAAEKFNPQMVVSALELVYENQKLLGNPTKALMAYERYTVLKDSLFNIEKISKINELEQQYNQVKNEKSIVELKQDQEIYRLRNRLLLFGVLLAGLVIMGLVFLQRQRALKAKQVTLETEQRLNRARMNPHFFFNALGALQGLILKNNDGRTVVTHLSKFASIMRQTLEMTYADTITIAEEQRYLEQYLDLQKLRFPDNFKYVVTIADDLDEAQVLVPPMLVQPFAENAIEHGFSDTNRENLLSIRFSKTKQNELLLEVEDNGQGLHNSVDRQRKHVSRAIQIIEDRLQVLNQQYRSSYARFEVTNKASGGVLAQIYLPLIKST